MSKIQLQATSVNEQIGYRFMIIFLSLIDLSVLIYFMTQASKYLLKTGTTFANTLRADPYTVATWVCLAMGVLLRDFVFLVFWPLDLSYLLIDDDANSFS